MKAIALILCFVNICLSVFGALPRMPLRQEQARRVDMIAMVSVTGVTTNTVRTAAERRISIVVGAATFERVLKGAPPKTMRLKQELTPEVESTTHLENGRFLVFLTHTGDEYEIVNLV